MKIPLRPSGVTGSVNQRAVNLLGARVFFPQRHAKTELECGTLLLFVHLNLAQAVKENENLMHCINLRSH